MLLVLVPLLRAGDPAEAPRTEPTPAALRAIDPWERDVAHLLAAPEDAEARLGVIREQMLSVAGDATSRDRLRAVVPVVTALDAGPPLPFEARLAVFLAALADGAEAGKAALATAQEAVENDPATAAADAWIGPFLDDLLAAASHEQADVLLEAAAAEHAGATAIGNRLAAARAVLEALPEGPPSRRAKARPLLERALSRSSAVRAEVASLVASFDGQLELLRLGVREGDEVRRAHALAVVDAYWYVCASKRSPPLWMLVPDEIVADAGRGAKRVAGNYADEQCQQGEYGAYEASWTIAMGGEPATNTLPLLRGPLRPALDHCRAREVTIEVYYTYGAYGIPQEHAITSPAPARPPDCLERADAVTKVAEANAELDRRVAEVLAP